MSGVAFTISDSVVWAGDDTIRIYHVDAGQFQSLNGTGSSIWSLMASGLDTHQIAQQLTDHLAGCDPVAYREIRVDVESFLYGAYAGLVFTPLYNFVARRCGEPARR